MQKIINLDNAILDILFQPLVDHCPIERIRTKPAILAMFALIIVALLILGHLWALLFSGTNEISDLIIWVVLLTQNQFLVHVCVDVARMQRPGHLSQFRMFGFVFRLPLLLCAIVLLIWHLIWVLGVVVWLWWIATCFLGCQSAPPLAQKRSLWAPG